MTLTRTATIRLFKYMATLVAILIIAAYVVSRSLDYARGPKIDITYPQDGTSISSTTVIITGRVERASGFTMNGSEVLVDQDGNWNEIVAVFPGQNIITLKATDRFGRSVEKRLNIAGLYTPPPREKQTMTNASSTATSSDESDRQ